MIQTPARCDLFKSNSTTRMFFILGLFFVSRHFEKYPSKFKYTNRCWAWSFLKCWDFFVFLSGADKGGGGFCPSSTPLGYGEKKFYGDKYDNLKHHFHFMWIKAISILQHPLDWKLSNQLKFLFLSLKGLIQIVVIICWDFQCE